VLRVLLAFLIAPVLTAATYTVTNTASSGAGSLAQAVNDANANPGLDTIQFAIPGSPPFTISGGVPLVNDPVNLDASTQPGFHGAPVVELRPAPLPCTRPPCPSVASGPSGILSFDHGSEGSTVRGFVLNSSRDAAILSSSEVSILGNYIGTDVSGMTAMPNRVGVVLVGDNVRLGGTTAADRNVISGNTESGIELGPSHDAVISGNYIGTNAAGTSALPNGRDGVETTDFSSLINLIERPTISGNVISGNRMEGFLATVPSTSLGLTPMNVHLTGNVIGLDPTRTFAIPNGSDGVFLANYDDSVVSGNVISGNGRHGIWVYYFDMGRGRLQLTGNTIVGNAQDGLHATAEFLRTFWGATEWPLVAENDIHGNGGNGITADALQQIRRNSIYDNGGLAIGTHAFPDSYGTAQNTALRRPAIDEARTAGGQSTVRGSLHAFARTTTFAIDVYDNNACDTSGFGEARTYVASQTVTTDADGNAQFVMNVPQTLHLVTAIATVTAHDDCTQFFRDQLPCPVYSSTSVSNCALVATSALPAFSPLALALLAAVLATVGILTAAARP